jgi:hypothetical protein
VLGGLTGALVGSHVGPSDKSNENAWYGAGIGALGGYILGSEYDKYEGRYDQGPGYSRHHGPRHHGPPPPPPPPPHYDPYYDPYYY